MFKAPQSSAGHAGNTGSDELKRAKMELVATRERSDPAALQTVLARYPQHAAALIEFSAALTATGAYAQVALTPQSERIAAQAHAQAFAAVFGSADAVPVLASLKALRMARQLTLKGVAGRLGLGVDVLSALEAGRIQARSVPARFLGALGAILDATADQVGAILGGQAALAPAYLRSKTGETKDGAAAAQLNFSDAIRMSPSMTDEQKAAWLES
jgi:transcriptional regulator with XRE-family HTH domain